MIWLDKYENFVAAYRAADEKLKKVMADALEYYKRKFSPGAFVNEFIVLTVGDRRYLVFTRNFFLPELKTQEGTVEPIEINNVVLPFDKDKFYPAQEIMMQAKIKQ